MQMYVEMLIDKGGKKIGVQFECSARKMFLIRVRHFFFIFTFCYAHIRNHKNVLNKTTITKQ